MPSPSEPQPRILLVDDNEDNRDAYSHYFRMVGMHIDTAELALEGIEKAIAGQPDLIVMDIQMPGMDGIEATRRLKADLRTRHIPVLMLSGSAIEADETCRAAGAAAYLMKPCAPQDLEREIRRILNHRVA